MSNEKSIDIDNVVVKICIKASLKLTPLLIRLTLKNIRHAVKEGFDKELFE